MTLPKDFPVVELRRYTVREEERPAFARYFETYFPEAFQQAGALLFGHFFEREDPAGFTWIRGFHDMEERAAINEAFYGGPLWREHSAKMNERMTDYTNVLLLEPVAPGRGIPILPAVDPVHEERGVQGLVIAQIFAVEPGGVEAFVPQAEEAFARYRDAGAREAGVLVTLDVPNNFPKLPVRSDGPHLVWLGILEDDRSLGAFRPEAEEAARALLASGLLRGAPELTVLEPTSRSRLRWR